MKYMFQLIFTTICILISSHGYADDEITIHTSHATGTERIIKRPALNYFMTTYTQAQENKAFAQSSSGAWAGRVNVTTIENAKLQALVACQGYNTKESLYPCEIIDLNGSLMYE